MKSISANLGKSRSEIIRNTVFIGVSVAFIVIFIVVMSIFYQSSIERVRTLVSEIAENRASRSSQFFNSAVSSLETFGSDVMSVRDTDACSRDVIIAMQRGALKTHEELFGINVVFLPDMFDGADKNFVSDPVYEPGGQFMPYVYRREKGQIRLETSYTEGDMDWYNNMLEKPEIKIDEPYTFLVGDEEKSLISIYVPLFEGDKLVGMVCGDIEMFWLSNQFKNEFMMEGYAFLISGNGVIIANSYDSSLNGTSPDASDLEWMKASRSAFKGETVSSSVVFDGKDMLLVASPIVAPWAGDNWVFAGVVPNSEIIRAFNRTILFVFVILLFIFLGCICVIAYYSLFNRETLDPLTGLYNRGMIDRNLLKDIKFCLEEGKSMCLIIADIDNFKHINDTYGHSSGDLILKDFSAIMLQNIRKATDWVGRYGGEEFLVALIGTSPEKAAIIAERLRKNTESSVVMSGDKEIRYTSSFGAAMLDPKAEKVSPQDLFEVADSNLYKAKCAGKNRVFF